MKRIAVLMTCYNRCETTLSCLRTLFAQNGLEDIRLDVWLVDDASPDKTGARVKAAYPQVNVVYSKGNLFWCKGMRLAWDSAASYSDYDYYLWLNDDVMLSPNALQILSQDVAEIEIEQKDGNYVLAGQCCSDVNPNKIVYGCYAKGVRFFKPDGVVHRLNDCAMTGNFVLIPRTVFRKIGPICNRYWHAFGDEDYRRMMAAAGIPLFCMSSVVGSCPQQPERYLHLKDRNFLQRLALLGHPKGLPLHDSFVYKYRHWGLFRALLSAGHIVTMAVLGYECGQEVKNS